MSALANKIARDIFTNGAKKRANRLVLELPGGRNGGGWCEMAVADLIDRHLSKSANRKKGKRKP